VIAPPAPRRPAPGGGLAVLVVVTVLAALAAPHARAVRGLVAGSLPVLATPESPNAVRSPRAARAVAFALHQQGKPYRWGAEGPHAFDCSGLTWAAWRTAGVAIPRTAAGQLAGPPGCAAGCNRVTWSSTPAAGRRGGMWPWSSAPAGWSRPPPAASRCG
jgi:NlpC/P60 family